MKTESPHLPKSCLLGAHFSIAGGLHHAMDTARSLGCNTAQIFTKNASTWKERTLLPPEIDRFAEARAAAGIETVASHTSYLIHLNDAKNPLGSRVDRHAHIGKGHIGLAAFGFFMNDPRLTQIPKVLETPKDSDGDRKNLTCLRRLLTP